MEAAKALTEKLTAKLDPLWAAVSFDSIPRGATVTADVWMRPLASVARCARHGGSRSVRSSTVAPKRQSRATCSRCSMSSRRILVSITR